MRKIIVTAVLAVLAACLAVAGFAGPDPEEGGNETLTMAQEYGLRRDQVASFDTELSNRLIRFGKVAMYRGNHLEAKRFFWKAVMVDPTCKLAWQYYDQAVLYTVADQVERMPGLVGLPGLSDQPGETPEPLAEEVEEGC